jgi:hypothetical protein
VETAILLLIWLRKETTKKVFEQIRKVKPKRLYVASDGPRNESEKIRIQEVRDLINVDWDCEVKTLYRDKNLGCDIAIPQAISWFFKNEEMGIILEDDIYPDVSFFQYCEELLNKYKNNEKIMSISGYNHKPNYKIRDSYYFRRYFNCLGWASWRRVWKFFDNKILCYQKFKENNMVNEITQNKIKRYKILKRYNSIYNSKSSVVGWDWAYAFNLLCEKGLIIYPRQSLTTHLGFDMELEYCTHFDTSQDKILAKKINKNIVSMNFPMKNSDLIEITEDSKVNFIVYALFNLKKNVLYFLCKHLKSKFLQNMLYETIYINSLNYL